MRCSRRRRAAAGVTYAESLAAVALLAVGLTCSYSLLVPGGGGERQAEEAALRAAIAERLLEETLALRFQGARSRSVAIPAEEASGRSGWKATVRVESVGPHLKEVTVSVRGEGRVTVVRTRLAPWRVAR